MVTNNNESMTHIFLKPCGCLSCAIVEKPTMFREIAKAFQDAAKNNETHKLVTTQFVREMKWTCLTHKKPAKPTANQANLFKESK
jgi:hypothetical protein